MSGQDDKITFDLCSDDRQMLDRLVDAGFDIDALGPLSDIERQRANQILRMLGLMNDYPVADADDALIHVTMARIDQHDRDLAQGLRLAGSAGGSEADQSAGSLSFLREWRLPDFLTIAASLLIITSLTMHLLGPSGATPANPGAGTIAMDPNSGQAAAPSQQAGFADELMRFITGIGAMFVVEYILVISGG